MVAQLTNLRHLDWESNPCLKDTNSLTDAGLLELTALQGLTHLAVVGWTGGGLLLTGSLTSHSEAAHPDVYLQLSRLFEDEQAAHTAATPALGDAQAVPISSVAGQAPAPQTVATAARAPTAPAPAAAGAGQMPTTPVTAMLPAGTELQDAADADSMEFELVQLMNNVLMGCLSREQYGSMMEQMQELFEGLRAAPDQLQRLQCKYIRLQCKYVQAAVYGGRTDGVLKALHKLLGASK